MNKQQAAEAYQNGIAWKWQLSDAKSNVVGESFIAGCDWQAAQYPGDAVAFAEWMLIKEISFDKWHNCYLQDGTWIADTTAELYKLFNPSGAAPQVFTREQVAKAYADGAIASQKRSAGEDFQTDQEYMDTNYPVK